MPYKWRPKTVTCRDPSFCLLSDLPDIISSVIHVELALQVESPAKAPTAMIQCTVCDLFGQILQGLASQVEHTVSEVQAKMMEDEALTEYIVSGVVRNRSPVRQVLKEEK